MRKKSLSQIFNAPILISTALCLILTVFTCHASDRFLITDAEIAKDGATKRLTTPLKSGAAVVNAVEPNEDMRKEAELHADVGGTETADSSQQLAQTLAGWLEEFGIHGAQAAIYEHHRLIWQAAVGTDPQSGHAIGMTDRFDTNSITGS